MIENWPKQSLWCTRAPQNLLIKTTGTFLTIQPSGKKGHTTLGRDLMSQLAIKSHRNNQNARGCLISSILQEIFMFESPSMSVRSEVVGCFHPQFLSQNQRLVFKKSVLKHPPTSLQKGSILVGKVTIDGGGKKCSSIWIHVPFRMCENPLFFESLQRGKRAKEIHSFPLPIHSSSKKKTSFEKSRWNCETGGICWGVIPHFPFDPQLPLTGLMLSTNGRLQVLASKTLRRPPDVFFWIWGDRSNARVPVENTWSMLFVGNTHLQHSNGQWLLKTILIQHCLTPWVPTWSSSSLGFKTCAAYNHFQDANLPASFVWLPFQLSLEHDLPPNTPRFWKFHSQEWNVQMLNFKNEMHKLMCPHGESAPSCAILY